MKLTELASRLKNATIASTTVMLELNQLKAMAGKPSVIREIQAIQDLANESHSKLVDLLNKKIARIIEKRDEANAPVESDESSEEESTDYEG